MVALVMASGIGLFTGSSADAVLPPGPPPPPASGTTMHDIQGLFRGSALQSANGHFVLAMQTDGNVVLYADGVPTWQSGTASESGYLRFYGGMLSLSIGFYGGCDVWHSTETTWTADSTAVMQDDGNFVVYTPAGEPLWSTGTAGVVARTTLYTGGTMLNGDVLEHVTASHPGFGDHGSGRTSKNGDFIVVAQDDGNVVLYRRPGIALWQTDTAGNPGAYLVSQCDGNLVLYTAAGRPLWQSGTSTNTYPSHRAELQDDGNFVVYSKQGEALWQSGSYAK